MQIYNKLRVEKKREAVSSYHLSSWKHTFKPLALDLPSFSPLLLLLRSLEFIFLPLIRLVNDMLKEQVELAINMRDVTRRHKAPKKVAIRQFIAFVHTRHAIAGFMDRFRS
jgi:hypothetical protein